MTTENNEELRELESVKKRRNAFFKLESISQDILDKQMLIFSSGGLALSITFIKDIADKPICKGFIIIAWFLWFIVIIITFCGHYSAVLNGRKGAKEITESIACKTYTREKIKEINSKYKGLNTEFLNNWSFRLFIGAMVSFMIFVIINYIDIPSFMSSTNFSYNIFELASTIILFLTFLAVIVGWIITYKLNKKLGAEKFLMNKRIPIYIKAIKAIRIGLDNQTSKLDETEKKIYAENVNVSIRLLGSIRAINAWNDFVEMIISVSPNSDLEEIKRQIQGTIQILEDEIRNELNLPLIDKLDIPFNNELNQK